MDSPLLFALFTFLTIMVAMTGFAYRLFYKPGRMFKQLGTPVITSNRTSLPEVAGDAAILVDPGDITAIGAALSEVVLSATRRDALRASGARRADLFSWDRCARTAGAVLARAARDRG